MFAVQLKELVGWCIANNEKLETICLQRKEDKYKALFTSVHYSDLHLIKLV
jgi:hypothetical protein